MIGSINIDCIEPKITRTSRVVTVGQALRLAVLGIGNRERLPYKISASSVQSAI